MAQPWSSHRWPRPFFEPGLAHICAATRPHLRRDSLTSAPGLTTSAPGPAHNLRAPAVPTTPAHRARRWGTRSGWAGAQGRCRRRSLRQSASCTRSAPGKGTRHYGYCMSTVSAQCTEATAGCNLSAVVHSICAKGKPQVCTASRCSAAMPKHGRPQRMQQRASGVAYLRADKRRDDVNPSGDARSRR